MSARRVARWPSICLPWRSLPVDQHLGNLEGKELSFGTSAGAVFAAITTDVTCGAINAEMDSLNPVAGLSPFIGMWLNCVFGGKGVGMINLLLFLIIGIFLAGQMVGRTPEYLGRKIGAREDEARHDRAARASAADPRAERIVCSHRLGDAGGQQCRPARSIANGLPILLSLGE